MAKLQVLLKNNAEAQSGQSVRDSVKKVYNKKIMHTTVKPPVTEAEGGNGHYTLL